MLIRNVDIAGCHVHRWVRTLVLTELRVIGSDSKVRESPRTLGERVGTAIITDGCHGCATEGTYSTTGRTDIANRDIDLPRAIEPEVGIGHVEATSHRVNRQEIFVKEATELQTVEHLALRTCRNNNRLAAGYQRSNGVTRREREVVHAKDGCTGKQAADVEVGLPTRLARLNAGVPSIDMRRAVAIGQTTLILEGLATVGRESETR